MTSQSLEYRNMCPLTCIRHLLKVTDPNSLPDERIIEYDVDKVLFEKESPFQKVQIVHTNSVGNMLVLDELQSKKI